MANRARARRRWYATSPPGVAAGFARAALARAGARDQLYEEAKRMGVEGRSGMSKSQLQRALDGKKR